MTMKDIIKEALKGEADNATISEQTGATIAYVEQIAGELKAGEEIKVPKEKTEPKETPPEVDSGGMDFDNDLENNGANEMADNKDKNGVACHKEWIKAKGYECECGCVLNRKSTFCPHCGVTLDWGGF